jgi:hypothetical protein
VQDVFQVPNYSMISLTFYLIPHRKCFVMDIKEFVTPKSIHSFATILKCIHMAQLAQIMQWLVI